MADYLAGNLVRLSAAFADDQGADVDPTTVKLTYGPPSEPTTLVYGTDAALVKDSAGHYHADVDTSAVTAATAWLYEWTSTGTGQAAASGRITITPLPLAVG